jgi:hypothetical protein
MRPGPTADRGKISEYVGAVRGARRRLSNAKPGTANAAEAKQGLKDNRQALSRRIQRERGARRGLKPATSQQVLTSTVPAPPARRMKAARPAGTVAKPRGLKPDRWIKKERVIGKGEVWMGKWTPPSGGKAKRRKASAEATKATKAERVIARIEGNQARGSTVARSKKEDRRLARTLAISQFAKSYVSERAVGNRDPNAQYKKADLLPQLNKALSRPTPKKQRKSTTRSNDPEKGLIALGVGAALKTRARYRAEGRLLPARRSSRRPRKPKP